MAPTRISTAISRSAIAASSRPASAATTRMAPLVSRRYLSAGRQMMLKESASQDEDFEKHKQDSLDKAKAGKPQWKEELASDGEEAVKADKEGHKEDIESLQERTKGHAEDKHQAGTSQKPSL